MTTPKYSDYVVYIDESGDHGLSSIDPGYPVFVLAFCVFKKSVVYDYLYPSIAELKFRLFGRETIIFHESDIRREKGDFSSLPRNVLKTLISDISNIMSAAEFNVFYAVYDKASMCQSEDIKRRHNGSLYEICLGVMLPKIQKYLLSIGQSDKITRFIFESRNPDLDKNLELFFRRYCDEFNFAGFEIEIAAKKKNVIGLQVADLVARPLGLMYLRPDQPNRACAIVQTKIYAGQDGKSPESGSILFAIKTKGPG